MKPLLFDAGALKKTLFRAAALVRARLLRRSLRDELARLEGLPAAQGYTKVGVVLATLFALAIIAASFGWWCLGLYFALVVLLFH